MSKLKRFFAYYRPHNGLLILDLEPINLPPWYIANLTLMIPPGTPIHKKKIANEFHPMNADEILAELRCFIDHIDERVQNCTFRSNHASNYLAIKGVLSKDRQSILNLIDRNIKDHRDLRPEWYRAL